MEMNKITQWVLIGAAVLILLVGGGWLAFRGENPEPTTNTNATTTPSTSTVSGNNMPDGTVQSESDGESVTVTDQAAGTSVAIESMGLTRASWIAVRDDKSILGAAWFPSNATTGAVKLRRATMAGEEYRVVIYVDDGDKKFDFKKDQLITAGDSPVGTSFTAN